MNNFDEIVNKYVDNELSKTELIEVEKLLSSNDTFKQKLLVQKFVHDSLYDMPAKIAPKGLTELIMNKVVAPLSDKYKKNYFFRGVVISFITIFVIIFFWFFYFLGDLELTKSAVNYSENYSNKFLPSFSDFANFIKTDIFKTITGVVGFIVLLGFYFNMNSHKALKERLKEL